MADTQLRVPQGDFDLIRYPPTRDPNLRAWDAADELLLSHLDEVMRERPISKVLIVNDFFGAITVAVSAASKSQDAAQVRFVSDSHVAVIATRQNLDRNSLDPIQDVHIDGADAVLIKIPKTLALLEAQLVQLRDSLQPTTVIVAAGMTRDIHSSTLDLFEQTLGADPYIAGQEKGPTDLHGPRSGVVPDDPRANRCLARPPEDRVGQPRERLLGEATRQRHAPPPREPSGYGGWPKRDRSRVREWRAGRSGGPRRPNRPGHLRRRIPLRDTLR